MISVSPRTYINVNPDDNGGFYVWTVQEVNSLEHIVKGVERSSDGKWLYLYECQHLWTLEQLMLTLNMEAKFHGNIYFTKQPTDFHIV